VRYPFKSGFGRWMKNVGDCWMVDVSACYFLQCFDAVGSIAATISAGKKTRV